MKRILFLLACASLFASLYPVHAVFAQDNLPPNEPESGAVVCEPDAYPATSSGCLALGPSRYLSDLASRGLTFPPRPLPAFKPDPNLSNLPYRYYDLNDDEYVPIYSSPGEKGAGVNQFPPGFVYVSYVDVWEQAGTYFMLENGGWIPGKGARVGEIPRFQGLQFSSTPRNSFGWSYDLIPIKVAPGYNAPDTGNFVNIYEVVQVYDTQNVDNADWNMIGPNQWVEGRKIVQVTVNTTPPEGVTNNRWIEVNLAEQSLAVYENRELVFATVIASGLEPYWTQPGLFQIFQKKETETMRNNNPAEFYYLDNVPWTMYYDGARALHGAYWRTRLGYPQSHGCVNLSVGDAHWLYNWAVEGDFVYVHDPSGLTPTDPNLYPNYAY